MERLKLAIPNGSLQAPTLRYLRQIGFAFPEKPGRDNRLGVAHDLLEAEIRDRENIAELVFRGMFDCGITGADMRLNQNSVAEGVGVMCALTYSRESLRPCEYVLAGPRGMTEATWGKMRRRRIGAERMALARHCLRDKLRDDDSIIYLPGCEEQAIRDGLCDAVFVMSETGRSVKENQLDVIYPELFYSTPELLYCPNIQGGSVKYFAIQEIGLGLQAVLGAADRIMVVFDILTGELPMLHGLIAGVSPTVSQTLDPAWQAGQVLVPRHKCGEVLRLLKANGAQEIAMHSIDGYLP